MNARAMEVPAIHEFIFGDRQLHARFSLAIELLARIVTTKSQSVTTVALAEAVGQSPRTVRGVLAGLCQSGLLCRDERGKNAWFCASALDGITLADIFCSVAGAAPENMRKKACEAAAACESRSASQQNIELLLMQATMAINQTVLQHLEAFDLGRLKAVRSGSHYHRFETPVRGYLAEPV